MKQDLQGTSVTPHSPPRPNLKEIRLFVKNLRDPANQGLGGSNICAANLIEFLLSERDEVRDGRQRRVSEWVAAAFGSEHASSIEQRGLRLAEEAIEAAQAARCDPATLHKLIDYIYAKPSGELRQELGGVGLCVLAMAAAAGFGADEAERAEIGRVLSKPLTFFAERNRVKNEAGFVAGWQQPRAMRGNAE